MSARQLCFLPAVAFALSSPALADAACNLIPQSQQSFRGTLGVANRPFAVPGDFVELSVRPQVCDQSSPGFTANAADHDVTLVFTPPNGGPRRVVLLTAASCSAQFVQNKLNTCDAAPGVASVSCLQVSTSADPVGLTVVNRQGQNRLAFRFPDTDTLLPPAGDGLTLSGPVAIGVTRYAAPSLPCGLATGTCASQSGLVACIDALFALDGTCGATPDAVFPHFTALPRPNDYSLDCYSESPPCNPTATGVRVALDQAGNILMPMNWSNVILRPSGVPVPRLLNAKIKSPVPFRIPSQAFVDSFTPEGGLLPPIFEPQFDPTVSGTDVVTLFGSVDASASILRIARHRGRCAGGSNDAAPCSVTTDCGTGTCVDACADGANDGLACSGPGDCPGGRCGSLYDAATLQLLTGGGGPLVLPRLNGGLAGLCQLPPYQNCTTDAECSGVGNLCVLYSFEAQDPVPLEGLTGSADVFSFVVNEAIDVRDRNGDGDAVDRVVTLRDRTTGVGQALGAPASCSIAGTPEGRAILPIYDDPFLYPAVVAENDVIAFLENESDANSCDINGNQGFFDPILRVVRLGGGELTASLAPTRTVDPAPAVNGQSLVLSNGSVFYRRSESAEAAQLVDLVSVDAAGAQAGNGGSIDPFVTTDGRFVAFRSFATDLVSPPSAAGLNLFIRDRQTGTTEEIDPGGPSARHTVSDDGRWVVFESLTAILAGDTNFEEDVFLYDRLLDTTIRVSDAIGGGAGDGESLSARMTPDGATIAFRSDAADLVDDDSNDRSDVFVYDRISTTLERASIPSAGGEASQDCTLRDLSPTGRFVLLTTRSGNMVSPAPPPGLAGVIQLYLRDRLLGTTERISVGDGGSLGNDHSLVASISEDGRYVAFESLADNLVPGDANSAEDIFLRDRLLGTTQLISVATGGEQGDGASTSPIISNDGRRVFFVSAANNLTPDDNGLGTDYFVHDVQTGVTEKTNLLPSGEQDGGLHNSLAPHFSADGHFAAFTTTAVLTPGDGNDADDVFLRGFDESDGSADFFANGVVGDTVLEVFDSNSSLVQLLCPAAQVVVAAGKSAFLRPEEANGNASCPGGPLNGDGDESDLVVHRWLGSGSAENLAMAATAVAMSPTLIAALVSEAGQSAGVLNGDGLADDTVVHVHPVSGGAWTNVGQAGDAVQVCGDLAVFLTPEAAQGAVLNGDGDQLDRVLQIYNPLDGALINVGQAAEEFVCSSNLIAFRTRESAQGVNLNGGAGDTDTDDYVAQVYDIGRAECIAAGAPANCLSNSGDAIRTCQLAACDPRIPYRADVDTVKFIAWECDDGGTVTDGCVGGGTDHSGDIPPFAGDLVIRVYNVRTNATQTIGRLTGGYPAANGGARGTGSPLGGAAQPGDPGAGVVYTDVGRCLEITGMCTGPADCGSDSTCSGGLCHREQGVCHENSDCFGNVGCSYEEIVVASADSDADGVPDHIDNCAFAANAEQVDLDADRVGDQCDDAVCGNGSLEVEEECDGAAELMCPGQCIAGCRCYRTPTPTPTRVPTATPPLSCGNALREGVEECDGDDDAACADGLGCQTNCVCAVCGDGLSGGDEECDGSDATLCPGDCALDCSCNSICGDELTEGAEECDGLDDAQCPDDCLSNCRCPNLGTPTPTITPGGPTLTPTPEPAAFDSAVLRRKAARIVIPAGAAEITATIRVKIVNADPADPFDPLPPHGIRLQATDGTCPPGTVLGVDFDRTAAGYQDSTALSPGKAKAAPVVVRVAAADFQSGGEKAPARCSLEMRVRATVPNLDPYRQNDRVDVDLDVVDENDPPAVAMHESVLPSGRAVKIVIPPTSEDGIKVKRVTLKPLNGNVSPVPEDPGHPIRISVSDGTCPPGTVTLLTTGVVTPIGGRSSPVLLEVRGDGEAFDSGGPKSPARCNAVLTAMSDVPGNVEPVPSNDTTKLVIDVYDKADYP